MKKLYPLQHKMDTKLKSVHNENKFNNNKLLTNDIRRLIERFRAEIKLNFDSMDTKIDSLKETIRANRRQDVVIIAIFSVLIAIAVFLHSK
jgi:hypothetical protein